MHTNKTYSVSRFGLRKFSFPRGPLDTGRLLVITSALMPFAITTLNLSSWQFKAYDP